MSKKNTINETGKNLMKTCVLASKGKCCALGGVPECLKTGKCSFYKSKKEYTRDKNTGFVTPRKAK